MTYQENSSKGIEMSDTATSLFNRIIEIQTCKKQTVERMNEVVTTFLSHSSTQDFNGIDEIVSIRDEMLHKLEEFDQELNKCYTVIRSQFGWNGATSQSLLPYFPFEIRETFEKIIADYRIVLMMQQKLENDMVQLIRRRQVEVKKEIESIQQGKIAKKNYNDMKYVTGSYFMDFKK